MKHFLSVLIVKFFFTKKSIPQIFRLCSKSLGFLLIMFGFASCATFFNQSTQVIYISTNPKKVHIHGAAISKVSPAKIIVKRSANPLQLTFQKDSLVKTLTILSKNSFHYQFSNIFTFGIGYLAEQKSPLRHAYPRRMYVDLTKNPMQVTRWQPFEKGSQSFNFSIPYFNAMYLEGSLGNAPHAGFWGFTAGYEYFYKTNRYISIQAGIATDFFSAIPPKLDVAGTYEKASALFVNVRNNYVLGSFHMGYGVHLSRLNSVKGSTDSVLVYQTTSNVGVGLTANIQYRISSKFYVGALYQPNFISLNTPERFKYQHLLSIEFIFKQTALRKSRIGYGRF
ncbi:MAG: hypothetical protein H7Y04_03385 [Verrucomicrobia bacterium]|nr:hypothetical protein [Cytophagales bacterium]